MAYVFPGQVTAFQVGNYFVGKYYPLLMQQPSFAHQFYHDASTMLRLDGARIDRATGMLQIHTLLMCQNYAGFQITAAHSLESWNGGVLLLVWGSVKTKDNITRRKFLQTFFLAPQEKGYFVLNDILQFLGEEHMHQYPAAILAPTNYPTAIIASNPIPESVSNYLFGGTIHTREFAASLPVQETVAVDNYSSPEPSQQVLESAEKLDETSVQELTTSLANITNLVRDPPIPAEEHVGEPTKHTYASILRIAKGQTGQYVSQGTSSNKMALSPSEGLHAPQAAQQSQPTLTLVPEKSEAIEEGTLLESEGESRSVYVGKLPPSITISELEEEFKNYGTIRPDGVSIRSRKETGVLYAFVEFEDSISVQNALKASPVQIKGRYLHVEGRRPNNGISRGRRGRGRGGYQSDGLRGRYGGRASGRVNGGQENGYRDYNNRSRGNGYLQQGFRQERYLEEP